MSVCWGKSVKVGTTPFVLPNLHNPQLASTISNDIKIFFSQFQKKSSGYTRDYDNNTKYNNSDYPNHPTNKTNYNSIDQVSQVPFHIYFFSFFFFFLLKYSITNIFTVV